LRFAAAFAFSYLRCFKNFAMSAVPDVVVEGTFPPLVDVAAVATEAVARQDSAVGDEPGLKDWAALKANTNESCDTCEAYFGKMRISVEGRLVDFLRGEPAVGGINLQGKLHEQVPGCDLKFILEPWRWAKCRKSLATNGYFDALGSLFWLSKAPPSWYGELLPASELTYRQMGSGRLVWSDENYMSSSADPMKRRYSIRFAISHQPIRGSLLVGLFAGLLASGLYGLRAGSLACWLAGWLACWMVGLLDFFPVFFSGSFSAWMAGCLACRPT
jgi:hypothetical protein